MKHFGKMTLKWFIIGVMVLIPFSPPNDAEARGYPPTTSINYSGTVKPIKNLAQYSGTVTGPYTTVYHGSYNSGGEVSGRHPGVDIAEPRNTPVRAIAEGIVRYAGDNGSSAGRRVIIEHPNIPQLGGHGGGTVYSYYAHLESIDNDILENQRVLRGTVIGFVGDSGGGTGVHLHFQLQNYFSSPGLYAPSITQAMRDAGQLTLAEVNNNIFDTRYYYNHSTPADNVAERTYNAMRLVQAHEVTTGFVSNTGSYYSGTNFSQLLKSQSDPEIDFEWFNGSPQGVPADYFSVRWQGTINVPESSWYTFYTTSDDGVKLWLDNNLIIDEWQLQSPHTYSAIRWIGAGNHTVLVEYFENNGGAMVQLAWQKMPSCTGYYWDSSETFNNWTFADPTLIRQDPSPFDFAWGTGSPAPGVISPDYFSVRWLGKIDVPADQWYKFTVRTDDGFQLRIDGRIVVHRWLLQGDTPYVARIKLTGGSHSLEVRYYEHTGGTRAKLSWVASASAGDVPVSRTGGAPPRSNIGGQKDDSIYEVGIWRPAEFYWGVDHIDWIGWMTDGCGILHHYAEGRHTGDEAEYLMMLGGGYFTDLTVWLKEDYPAPVNVRIWIDGQNKGSISFSSGSNCNGIRTIRLDDPQLYQTDDISYGPHTVAIEFINATTNRYMDMDGLQIAHW